MYQRHVWIIEMHSERDPTLGKTMTPHILPYPPPLIEAWAAGGATMLVVPMEKQPSAMYHNDGTGPYHYTQWPKTAWITRHPTPMGCEDHIAIPPFQSGDIVALTAWRCWCGAVLEELSPAWRFDGKRWQHHHGYPTGYVHAECHSVTVRILEVLAPKRFNDLSTAEWDSANYPVGAPWNEWWPSYPWTSNPYCWLYRVALSRRKG